MTLDRIKIGMKLVLAVLMVGTIVLSMGSCYYDNEEELYGIVMCDTSAVSFKDDIEPIVQNNCAISGCHIAGGSGNGLFINYAGIKDKVDNGSLRQRVVVARDMPVGFPLTDCQVDFIDAWTSAGAPNN